MRRTNLLSILFLIIFVTSLSGCKKADKPVVSNQNEIVTSTNEKVSFQNEKKDDLKVPKDDFKVPDEVLQNFKSKKSIHENGDLRKFPYPYKSMLALCSDIDNTTLEEFEQYHQFLNTLEDTSYGKGLGLDVGDTMWMYMGSSIVEASDSKGDGQEKVMTYFKGMDSSKINDASKIRRYYKAGWIDSLHTLGDFSRANLNDISFKRQYAIDAWKELNDNKMSFKVWINHGNEGNKQNFGAHDLTSFFKYQEGDNPNSPYYNSDLVIKNGVKFVWNSNGEETFARDNPLYPLKLRDGKSVWGFHRYTNDMEKGKAVWTWVPENLHRQITKDRLDKLAEKQQYSIVTQHFGVAAQKLFNPENIAALRLLKSYSDNGQTLVARTSRLLNYALMEQYVKYSKVEYEGKTWINISSIDDPIFGSFKPELDDIRGLTFYVSNPDNTYIFLDSDLIKPRDIQRNDQDNNSKKSISVKWFKEDVRDYSKNTKNVLTGGYDDEYANPEDLNLENIKPGR